MSEEKPKIHEFHGKFYTRTAIGGCAVCVFGSSKTAMCISGCEPKFTHLEKYRACFGLEGPAWEEVKNHQPPTTKKPKKPKTMSTTKKSKTSHSKPTTKGVRAEKKYPAPREMIGPLATDKPLDKMTKAELIEAYALAGIRYTNLAGAECVTGTKLDRALVDLREAKAKIKELTK